MPFADLWAHWTRAECLFLPPSCLLCDRAVPPGEGEVLVCALCRRRWPVIPHPVCPRCGAQADRDHACTFCTDWPDGLAMVRSAVWLDESARRTVHALKYQGWWRVAEVMAASMRGIAPFSAGDVLVPIPLGSRRRRRRGYNQSERLAAALAAVTGLVVHEELLVRSRETRSQTALTPEERLANIAGAFRGLATARGRRIWLVDDVFTTGATLLDAGRALHAADAAWVGAVTFARAGELLQ